ncbi:MAG: hypothetical protein VX208_04400, partial [SAR324 cluster bacterium]|nr:hypothetical protein [SAR324 cluster bacterium]
DWDFETMEALGIPNKIFPDVLKPGTKIGNYQKIPVILPACHDTASAVVSVPFVAGPAEATSIGNAMVQLMALGEIGNHEHARKIIAV